LRLNEAAGRVFRTNPKGAAILSPRTRAKYTYVTPPHFRILHRLAAKADLALMMQDERVLTLGAWHAETSLRLHLQPVRHTDPAFDCKQDKAD
jgi:hypothetical protein